MSAQHRQDVLGRQLCCRQRHRAGQCQACTGRCKVLCNRDSNYLQDSLDVHQDVAPQRGMAAAQPLTATRHDSLGQDVDESAVRAVSAVQGRGCQAPLEPWYGLGVPRAGCGRAAGLIRACGRTKAERVQTLPEGGCFPRSQAEGHWADPTPRRHCCPSQGAGGSQAGPGPP